VASEGHDRRSPRSLCAAVAVGLCILGGKWLKAAYLVYLGANTLLWKRTLSSCPDEDRYRHECQHGMVRWNQEYSCSYVLAAQKVCSPTLNFRLQVFSDVNFRLKLSEKVFE
jgi:hypothetical protein